MRRAIVRRRQQPGLGISLSMSLLFLLSALSATAFAQSARQPAPTSTCAASSVTLTNQNPYPIWIGENVGTGAILLPDNSTDWELDAGDSRNVCVPPDWTSGIFWARTECNFAGTFGQDPDDDYVDCTSASQCCTTGNVCTPTGQMTQNNHVCYGGKCVIDCSNSTGTMNNCSALPTSPASVCVGGGAAGSYCGYAGGVCKTGDCGSGLYQCQGNWDSLSADAGPGTPATQFEITDNSGADGGAGAASYDVTNLAGYNNPIDVSLDFTPSGPTTDPACYATSCNTDLNTICPSLLQVIEPPTASPATSVSCGGGYCQSGACEQCPSGGGASCSGGMTCVIGCGAPGKLCGSNYPSPVSAPGVASLECDTTIPGFDDAPELAEYRDMYDAANDSGIAVASPIGVTMFSGNQGTPTCWGGLDCAPGETCLIGPAQTGISGLPSYVGICATSNPGGIPTALPVTNCNSTTDIGMHCGGYPNSSVYTCVAASGVSSEVACLPSYNPPIKGLGTLDSSSGFFTGIGAPLNPEWQAAALWASGNGTTAGTTPYYETFSNACPHQYAWTYDDHTGGLACNSYPLAFTVSFGLLGAPPSATATPSPTATVTATATTTATATGTGVPTPTATATATASLTPTASATSTATATASSTASSTATSTASQTPTATATGTATPTATSSASLTPTATATITATATATASPSATPTMTPTPTGTATPGCAPSFLSLATNPSGTFPFPAAVAGHPETGSMQVTNSGSPGSLDLSTKITGGDATDFKVIGGSCTTINRLKTGATCSYELKLKAKKKFLGAVNANLEITGTFRQGVCPKGDVQNVGVLLSGFVASAGSK